MKTTLLFLGFWILFPFLSVSQKDRSGIYITSNDFINQKLSFTIDCKSQKHKIKSDLLFHEKEISIKHSDTTYIIVKDSLYGIKDCDGTVERIWHNSEYLMLNPSETILIYKVVTGNETKNSPSIAHYYFSKNADGEIQDLTIYNIKSTFPDNHKFHDILDLQFQNDDDLIKFDNFHKIMKINRVLFLSLEN